MTPETSYRVEILLGNEKEKWWTSDGLENPFHDNLKSAARELNRIVRNKNSDWTTEWRSFDFYGVHVVKITTTEVLSTFASLDDAMDVNVEGPKKWSVKFNDTAIADAYLPFQRLRMKTHTERPRSGNARLAWDYFCQKYGPPQEMYYSTFVEFDEGPAWVGEYPDQANRYPGYSNNDGDWHSVTNLSLKQWAEKQPTISASAPRSPQKSS